MRAVIVVLATHRLVKLITEDEVARPVREKINGWAFGAPELSFKERINTLIQCRRCVGVWAAGAMIAAQTIAPGRILAAVLATADVSDLLGLLEEDE